MNKSNRSPLLVSLLDIFAYLLFFLLAHIFHDLRHERNPFPLTLFSLTSNGIKIFSIVFSVAWVAVYIGCRLGVTTIMDIWGEPGKGWMSRVPGTLIITTIVGFLTSIVLLFMGQIVK